MHLQHEGVKGMQWGVQNGPPYPLSDAKRKKMIAAQRRRDYDNRTLMSDEEINSRVKRLELEKKYRDLTNEMVASGRSTVNKAWDTAKVKTLENAMTGAMAFFIGRGLTMVTGSKDVGSTIAKGNYNDSEVQPKNKNSGGEKKEEKKDKK